MPKSPVKTNFILYDNCRHWHTTAFQHMHWSERVTINNQISFIGGIGGPHSTRLNSDSGLSVSGLSVSSLSVSRLSGSRPSGSRLSVSGLSSFSRISAVSRLSVIRLSDSSLSVSGISVSGLWVSWRHSSIYYPNRCKYELLYSQQIIPSIMCEFDMWLVWLTWL